MIGRPAAGPTVCHLAHSVPECSARHRNQRTTAARRDGGNEAARPLNVPATWMFVVDNTSGPRPRQSAGTVLAARGRPAGPGLCRFPVLLGPIFSTPRLG